MYARIWMLARDVVGLTRGAAGLEQRGVGLGWGLGLGFRCVLAAAHLRRYQPRLQNRVAPCVVLRDRHH
jgi:hypothetical protein